MLLAEDWGPLVDQLFLMLFGVFCGIPLVLFLAVAYFVSSFFDKPE